MTSVTHAGAALPARCEAGGGMAAVATGTDGAGAPTRTPYAALITWLKSDEGRATLVRAGACKLTQRELDEIVKRFCPGRGTAAWGIITTIAWARLSRSE